MCSQCVHVYLKKGGVAIETKLKKAEDVKRWKAREELKRRVLNLVFPGASSWMDNEVLRGLVPLSLFVLALLLAFGRGVLFGSSRPGPSPTLVGTVAWLLFAAVVWGLGQRTAKVAA
jgi:hypothetical protein